MRWGPFVAGLLLVYVLQVGVLWRLDWPWADLFLAYALWLALLAPAVEARLACWVVGFAQDLGSSGPIGVYAFSLGLAGFFLTQLREVFNIQTWWPRWLALWLAAAPAFALAHLHRNAFGAAGEWNFFSALGVGLYYGLILSGVLVLLTSLPVLALNRRSRFRRQRA